MRPNPAIFAARARLRAMPRSRSPGTSRDISTAVVTIAAVIIGGSISFATVLWQTQSSSSAEIDKARKAALLETYKLQQGHNVPAALIAAETAMKRINYLSLATPQSIAAEAKILRENKYCWNDFSAECRKMAARGVEITRQALGTGEVPFADLETVLAPEIDKIADAVASFDPPSGAAKRRQESSKTPD